MSMDGKMLVTKEGIFNLDDYCFDDDYFFDLLTKHTPIDADIAQGMSISLREEILRTKEISLEKIEYIIEQKLETFGLKKPYAIKIGQSIFKRKIKFSDNARLVLERRYLRKDSDGKVKETPEDMFRRVARHIAIAERNYNDEAAVEEMEEKFFRLMTNLDFLPNSPTLMNAGLSLGQLAACFVLPVEDSMEGIFDSLKNAALIHKSGGGTGFSFSKLRAKNSRVGTTGGVASGPVSFMRIFNTATEQVKQGGTRRGANMGILRIDHPDILEFIHCKGSGHELNNFNISVAVTDAFMDAVNSNSYYDLVDPREQRPVESLNAREVYSEIIEQAWKKGDPGIIFIDRINKDNPTPMLGNIESTNPCGEQPLLPMEACNLGSINLERFVVSGENGNTIDYDRLRETVHLSVRFLDNTIDMSLYPLPEINAMVKGNRKIGLGIMGFADFLFRLRIPYNSEQALAVAEDIMSFINNEAHIASSILAEERGNFSNYEHSIYALNDNGKKSVRNATLTTIAPTGTLSIIADCSSGIEPLFALSFVRNVMDNDKLLEVNSVFEEESKKRMFYSEELMKTIADKGTISGLANIPDDVKEIFVTAHDVPPEWHVRMQAAFQKYTDNAVSKTVNLPKDATVDDIRKIYDLAFRLGCKGVTIYRDGSMDSQVLTVGEKESGKPTVVEKERPETLEGFTTRMNTGLGNLYVTVTEYEGRPFEVFATIGKSGHSTTAKTEAIGRLVSLALRSGVDVEKIVNQLKGIGGEHPVFQKDGLVLSIPDAIARILEKKYMTNGNGKKNGSTKSLNRNLCPECNAKVNFEEGCLKCYSCGYTKCGG